MKPLLLTTLVCVIAMSLVLFGYDRFVAQPREARLQLVVREAGQPLDAQQQQAREIAETLEQRVESVRRQVAQDARLQQLRARVANGLTRAQGHKLAVAETWMAYGRWPDDVEAFGLQPSESYASDALTGIDVAVADGTITLHYLPEFGQRASIRLLPTVRADVGSVDYRCEASGFDDINVVPEACR